MRGAFVVLGSFGSYDRKRVISAGGYIDAWETEVPRPEKSGRGPTPFWGQLLSLLMSVYVDPNDALGAVLDAEESA